MSMSYEEVAKDCRDLLSNAVGVTLAMDEVADALEDVLERLGTAV